MSGSFNESIVYKAWESQREAKHAELNTFVMTILGNNYYWQVFSSLWGLQALVTVVPFYSQLISQQNKDPVSASNNSQLGQKKQLHSGSKSGQPDGLALQTTSVPICRFCYWLGGWGEWCSYSPSPTATPRVVSCVKWRCSGEVGEGAGLWSTLWHIPSLGRLTCKCCCSIKSKRG